MANQEYRVFVVRPLDTGAGEGFCVEEFGFKDGKLRWESTYYEYKGKRCHYVPPMTQQQAQRAGDLMSREFHRKYGVQQGKDPI
jgi:hypothetical protein